MLNMLVFYEILAIGFCYLKKKNKKILETHDTKKGQFCSG